MPSRIAIIGSGPTGIYTLKGLVANPAPLAITVFEREAEPGLGTPYHPDINDRMMLSNIASIELPEICETLVGWLRRQSPDDLLRLGIPRDAIDERAFYPRVVLGEYLQAQFRQVVELGRSRGHIIDVKGAHRVADIELRRDDIRLRVDAADADPVETVFDHVVMATGHDWPDTTETNPGYFVSPWPAPVLKTIPAGRLGILGTSLSAIDALVTVATAHGGFLLDAAGDLQYLPKPKAEGFHATLMSRKGVLPEADFYCEIPYRPLIHCTKSAVDNAIGSQGEHLLDALFDLFRRELVACDPDYAASIGLGLLSVETVAPAYFRAREEADPFVWAAQNLAEAEANKKRRHTVEWRYAILRMHEVIAPAIPHLNSRDLKRFHKHFKTVFVDDYATVPHDSIRRLLALRRAGKLDIVALGNDSEIDTAPVERGAVVRLDGQDLRFDSFIDATGQSPLSARDIPFPTLRSQGVIRKAATHEPLAELSPAEDSIARTGGVDLDGSFRPLFEQDLTNRLYCGSIAFLLHKLPFVQGLTSARDIGETIAQAILDDESGLALSAA